MKIEIPAWKFIPLALALWLAIGAPHGGGCSVVVPAAGPRQLLVVRETADTTPEFGRYLTELRAGETAKYLKEKKHTLEILDQNGKDENGQPAAELVKYQPFSPPELFIIAPPDKLLSRQKLPPNPAELLAAVKANGG